MNTRESLRQELLADMDALHTLILRYAFGDTGVRRTCDDMARQVRVKLALFTAMRSSEATASARPTAC